MRLVQTRNKRLVFGILFSALIVGIMLTIGQVPLAVSQPVTIPVKAIKGIPDGWCKPHLGRSARCHHPIERPNHHDSDAPEYLGEIGVCEGGHQWKGFGVAP
ncbi:MAG: hypothetical protein MRJ92_07575 [Nitrospira sp.]|nr:hypothetical protein [Nitrospira sp.]